MDWFYTKDISVFIRVEMGVGTQDEKVGYQCASQENLVCLARLRV